MVQLEQVDGDVLTRSIESWYPLKGSLTHDSYPKRKSNLIVIDSWKNIIDHSCQSCYWSTRCRCCSWQCRSCRWLSWQCFGSRCRCPCRRGSWWCKSRSRQSIRRHQSLQIECLRFCQEMDSVYSKYKVSNISKSRWGAGGRKEVVSGTSSTLSSSLRPNDIGSLTTSCPPSGQSKSLKLKMLKRSS